MIKNKYKCECGFLIYSYGAFMIKNFQKWVYMEWVFFFFAWNLKNCPKVPKTHYFYERDNW